MMNWEKIKYFYEACQDLNISKTALRIHISQPALSRHITNLEEILRTVLFIRARTGLTLTDRGILFYKFAKKMAREAESFMEITQRDKNNKRQKLDVEISVTLGTMWLPYYIPGFVQENPTINLSVQGLQDENSFLKGFGDVAISTYLPDRPDLIQNYLMTFHLGLYASLDYLSEKGVPNTFEDLKNYQLISYGSGLVHRYGTELNEVFRQSIGVLSNSALEINMGSSLVTVASKGLGIIVLSKEYPGLKDSKLVQILPEIESAVDIFSLIPKDKNNNKNIYFFENYLNNKLKKYKK